ncbi:MAG: hypothetical protein ACNA8H_04950 [Anaerolineales bacterium]
MDELICPHCGTPNPPDLEVCQVCQRRFPQENSQEEKEPDFPADQKEGQDSESRWELDNAFLRALEGIESITNVSEQGVEEEATEGSEERIADSGEEKEDSASEEFESGDTLPVWLTSLAEMEFGEQGIGATEESGEEDAVSGIRSHQAEGEFSDLLSTSGEDVLDEQKEADGTEEAVEDKSELEPAELPDWLAAIKPIEYTTPAIQLETLPDEHLESGGPLAGIWGALQPEADLASEGEPRGSSVVLSVSDNHRVHADLLQGMLQESEKPSPLPESREDSSHTPIRWVIAFILILSIIWTLIDNSNSQNPSSLAAPPEVISVFNLINRLSAQDRVLVAFEFEPGISPELDAAAAPIVDHLLLRDAYLTLVSTSPTGPLLAERFLASTQSDHSTSKNTDYVNLGFIPAGTAGLISFSQSPQRTLPFTIESELAWSSLDRDAVLPLQGIYGVADYAMVVVIVDQPDVARAWIEQVLPYLQEKLPAIPLVIITSAQSEPLIRPYYEAIPKQVQGMVTSLAGGTSYANLIGRDSIAMGYWRAFDAGLIVAALLILVGGVIIVSFNLYVQHKKESGETSE